MKIRKRTLLKRTILLAILFTPIILLINYALNSETKNEQNTKVKNKQTEKAKGKEPTEKPKEDPEITLTFSGDTMFDWQLRPVIQSKGADYPFQHVKPEIEKADYSFVNLESAFTTREKKYPGQLFWIKSDPSTLQAIKNTGYDIVNIGNNHTLDYYQDGLLDTISHVEKIGLPYIGAGKNASDAYTAREVTIKGKKFKFISFVRFMPDSAWVATNDKPGVANGYDLNLVTKTIKEQKKDADYMIVYMHWGVEKTNRPADYQKEYVQKMVEAGANAIVGSHPHWLQGFEYYNKVPVAYSLGNFLFPDYVTGHSAETGVLTLKFKGKDVQMSFNPYMIRNNQITPLQDTEKQNMLQYLQSISNDVQIDKNGNIINKRTQ
ncbi:capsular biosynthesis protein [Bacillus sp. AFS018417]|uniref:CapA family protein n=1 Tax=Bacillus sp. AFS018417 TaxID=2033491 RepID=UPI000BF51268|nr:CapA family protein [Bacillus sp. AFS018417]PEZ02924.1 capsular biosynthesis protein [Bacillus sp. AFS018417]